MLDGGNGAFAPNVLEVWECYGCYLTDVTYGDLKYSEQGPVTVSLTIQPDNCLQVQGGAQAPTSRTVLTNATGGGI